MDAYWLTAYGIPGAGSTNTTYIAGHSWDGKDAPFNRLSDESLVGKAVTVTTAKGTLDYTVDSVATHDKNTLKDSDIWNVVPNRIVLISCYTEDPWGKNVVVTPPLRRGEHASPTAPSHPAAQTPGPSLTSRRPNPQPPSHPATQTPTSLTSRHPNPNAPSHPAGLTGQFSSPEPQFTLAAAQDGAAEGEDIEVNGGGRRQGDGVGRRGGANGQADAVRELGPVP